MTVTMLALFLPFFYKVFFFIDKIKLYIQLESHSVHFMLQSRAKIFLSTLGSFDLSFLLRVEQQVSEVRRWTLAGWVLERGPWPNQHKTGWPFSSSHELLFWQCENDAMDPLERGRGFCDLTDGRLSWAFHSQSYDWNHVSKPPTMWTFCQSTCWHWNQRAIFLKVATG